MPVDRRNPPAARAHPALGRRLDRHHLYGAFQLIARMRAEGETGSVVTLICDSGVRYAGTYYSDEWVAAQGWDLAPHRARLDTFLESGVWGD